MLVALVPGRREGKVARVAIDVLDGFRLLGRDIDSRERSLGRMRLPSEGSASSRRLGTPVVELMSGEFGRLILKASLKEDVDLRRPDRKRTLSVALPSSDACSSACETVDTPGTNSLVAIAISSADGPGTRGRWSGAGCIGADVRSSNFKPSGWWFNEAS